MTGIAQVYQDILSRIDNIIDSSGNKIFNWRAVFNDQIKRTKDGSGYSFWMPAVFVEIKTHNEGSIGDQLTYAEMDIIFHIVHNELDDAYGLLDQNTNVFQFRDYIKSNFSLFKPTNCGVFIWLGENQSFNHTNIYEYIVKYKCYYIDNLASPTITGSEYYNTGASSSFIITYTQSVS